MGSGFERERYSDSSAERMITAVREGAARLNGIIQSTMDAIITGCESRLAVTTPERNHSS